MRQRCGICTYDDAASSLSATPPVQTSSPTTDCPSASKEDACSAKASDGCHWCALDAKDELGICLSGDLACPALKEEIKFAKWLVV